MTLRDLDHRERQRLLRSAAAGGLAWILFLILLVLIPSARKPPVKNEFSPVHLTLTSPVPAAAKAVAQEERPSPKEESILPAAEPPRSPAKAPAAAAPAKPAAKAPSSSKASAKPASKAPAASTASAPSEAGVPSGLGIPDFAAPVTSSRSDVGTSEYLDFSSPRPTERPLSSSVPPGGNPASEFSGTAASVSSSGGGAAVSSRKAPAAGGAASSDTEAALRSVEGAASSSSSSQGLAAGTSGPEGEGRPAGSGGSSAAAASSRTSSVAGLTFVEGASRKLINPENPRIVLPERLARLVNSDRTVTVQFTVKADGTVPGTLVFFTPSAVLPDDIKTWLRREFSAWRFEVGNQDGQARFTYSIKME